MGLTQTHNVENKKDDAMSKGDENEKTQIDCAINFALSFFLRGCGRCGAGSGDRFS
jgi:hypothetical protein